MDLLNFGLLAELQTDNKKYRGSMFGLGPFSADNEALNLVYQLKKQNVIQRSTVSIMENLLRFGERDASKIFVDDNSNQELVAKAHPDAVKLGQWLIAIQKIGYNQDRKIGKGDNLVALIDNTELSVQINKGVLDKIFAKQAGYKDFKQQGCPDEDFKYQFCLISPKPCSEYYENQKFGSIEFHLGKGLIMLKPQGYLFDQTMGLNKQCSMIFTGYRLPKSPPEPQIIFGQKFLDKIHTTFDYDSHTVTFNSIK